MFNIIKSNKMENLMDALVSSLKTVPDNPMVPEWIGIQSRGMKQWISLQMAEQMGICANIAFLFPRQMVDQILTGFNPLENQTETLTQDFLFWSVMKIIHGNGSPNKLSGVETYIREDETGKKRYQLAMRIAKVFDDYQAYRPDMLMNWQTLKPHETLKDPAALWQADLWRRIISKNPENHLAFRAQRFFRDFSSKRTGMDHLPSRMSLFGISALPELFLQVFGKVSEIMDINLFLLAPSNQFFFDIKSLRQIGKAALKDESGMDPELLYHEMTNPLLSSLGTSGKAFFSSIEAFNYYEPAADLFFDPKEEGTTLLTVLQSDILNLVHRKQGQEEAPFAILASDASVCVHACHSPMREAQVLKDLLLNEFEKDAGLNPHDVIVMMPDIEAYAPFIESVFSLETTLPISISDRRKKSESEPLDAFLKILALRNTRLEKHQVLDLLLSCSIARKFNILADEISRIETMVEAATILWGRDAHHRETLGLPGFEENTWQFGLQRLFMGMAMPENHEHLVQGVLPCPSFEGLDLEVLGKFAAFCHTLFSCLETLAGQKTTGKWCDALKEISNSLMDRNFQNSEDLAFLIQTIDQLKEDALTADFDDVVSFDVINACIAQKLDQNISQGNFMAGNITFCNIMPMRSIPFKIVVLMGMDEKSFPRRTSSPGFDLMKKYPKAGDKIEREDDRYLFLETLLSGRSKFIITYTGMSIQDNSLFPCAGVVSELMDTMDQSFIFPENYTYHVFHPLHPFHPAYFDQKDLFFSFSKDNCTIAKALTQGRPDKSMFVPPGIGIEAKEPRKTLTVDDMIRFFRNPVEGFMKNGLNINMKDLVEPPRERESFIIQGLDQYVLGSRVVEKNQTLFQGTDLYPVFKAMGSLPLGEKGRQEYEKLAGTAGPVVTAANAALTNKPLPALATQVDIDGITLMGNIDGIREDAVYGVSYGKLNGARLLSGWIRHLFLNACAPSDHPQKTILIGRDPKGKKPVFACSFSVMEPDAAVQYLRELTQIYFKGMEQPFYFFCETSWQFVQSLSREGFELTRDAMYEAMNRSKTSWYGGYFQTGEKESRYISLCVEQNDPFESVEKLFSTGFARNAVRVYKPLLENLEVLS